MTKSTKYNDSVGIREVYELVDSKVGKVNDSINRLESKFDALESGRLTSLESRVATLIGEQRVVPILISLAIGIFTLIVNFVLTKGGN